MLTTTLNRIKEHSPCEDGWKKLLMYLGKTKADDESLPYSVIVASNGLGDALWCCRAEPQYHKEWRLFAVWCCGQIKHLMKDPRSINAVKTAKKHALGKATDEELAAARAAAEAAARAAAGEAARAAAWTAAWAAAREAAWETAKEAARAEAARAAARATARAAARAAVREAAWAAAREAARKSQKEEFLRIVG
jgi:hypothetical protein